MRERTAVNQSNDRPLPHFGQPHAQICTSVRPLQGSVGTFLMHHMTQRIHQLVSDQNPQDDLVGRFLPPAVTHKALRWVVAVVEMN